MKFSLSKIHLKIKKNSGIFFLILVSIISIFSMQIYNFNKDLKEKNYINLINNTYFQKSLNYIIYNLEPKYVEIEHKVINGETFDQILKSYKISQAEINKIKKKISKYNNLSNLKANSVIKFTINQSLNKVITNFIYPVSRTEKIQLTRDLDKNIFITKEIITNLNKKIIFKEGKITQSLYKSAIDLNISANIVVEFARIYGFQVDFQRDIRKNDSFQIMYEVFEDDNEKVFETGNIVFANLVLRGQKNELYYYDKKENEGHYDNNGKSVKKALMKSPINGARLSSKFGMRKHPIDGFNKMHRGTDFAAPEGTPIMASGSGIITRAKWCGGGGNCIKIKHNTTYQTIYAHLSKFASWVKPGVRVKQGQIIGFVGSTGKSTGPHLHYEVIKNGKKIDSQKLKLPSGKILKGKDRELFEVKKIKLDVLKSELILGLN
jgi:murein DD-endopeptidase MepM/ murein hydrolase activator NlpD